MNLTQFIKTPLLKKYLLKQLAYFSNGCYVFEEQNKEVNADDEYIFKAIDSTKAKLVIVAQLHYQQFWQSYTSVSKKELQQIISLQRSNENMAGTIFQVFENLAIDGFDVKKIIFDQKVLDTLGEQRVLIPETELYYNQDALSSVLSLTTPAGIMYASYFANKSTSSYAKGFLTNIETFKLSSGLPTEIEQINIKADKYASYLFNKFTNQELTLLFKISALNIKSWFKAKELHLLYWMPLLSAILFYICSNTFLWWQMHSIENSLASQGKEITTLLQRKNLYDQKKGLLQLLNVEFSKTATVHQHWSLVYKLVEEGMIINQLTFNKNLLSVRGMANNASVVLTAVAKDERIESIGFNGTVRRSKSKGKDLFTLDLIPKNIVQPLNAKGIETGKVAKMKDNG